MDTISNKSMSFSYDSLPPTRTSPVNHEGLTPEQEWAKIADAAERRKIQNRNAQRKYRHNLKRRVEALERQHNLGSLLNPSNPSSNPDSSRSSTPKTEPQPQAKQTPIEKQSEPSLPKDNSTSPQRHTIDLMDPALTSIQNFGSSIEPDWMSHSFMSTPMSIQSTPLPSPPMTHVSQSPDMCTKTHLEEDPDQTLLSSSMMSLSSLDSYIQHNNSIIEDMCSSVSSDDLDLSYHHAYTTQRPGLQRRVTAPEPTLGRTTLHLAAMRGYLQIVHMLLEKGIDVNTRDSQGWTALHLAAERGQEEVVKLLLDRGADLYARV